MSVNRHELTMSRAGLDGIAAGQTERVRSDKDMMVLLHPSGMQLLDSEPGVVPCPVTAFMIDELRHDGHTGIAPAGSPYVFGINLEN